MPPAARRSPAPTSPAAAAAGTAPPIPANRAGRSPRRAPAHRAAPPPPQPALALRRGNQLHRLRDFLRVLNGANAPLQLARFGHYSALYSSIALRSRALRSSASARLVRISSARLGCCAALNSSRPFSHSLIFGTSTSSISPFVTAKITMIC